MNIFVLDRDPIAAAQMHCDKHVIKMVVESAQMLSTVHRLYDGIPCKRLSCSGKRLVSYWEHGDSVLEGILYKAVHVKHPCTIWTGESTANYGWHYALFKALADEYVYRYSRVHSTWAELGSVLSKPPYNITNTAFTPFKLAMGDQPQCIDRDDPVRSYRKFYRTKPFKMVWTKRLAPSWYTA